MVTSSPRNLLLAAILVSAIIGSVTGLATNYLMRISPAPQTRDFYLFARDLSFNFSLTSGPNALTSDYIYSANYVVINKGDTLVIHFYNPTDEHHSFTMESPYANSVTVAEQPNDQSPIHDATITIAASQAGTFQFHCIFHPPQMRGNLIVEG